MKQKNLGSLLILVSALVLTYSFSMNISIEDSDVVNIHLLSNRQNALYFGGILLLAGILLFSLSNANNNDYKFYLSGKISRYYSYLNRIVKKTIQSINYVFLNFKSIFALAEDGLLLIATKITLGVFFGVIVGSNLAFIAFRLLYRSSYEFPWLYRYHTDDYLFYLGLLIIFTLSIAKGSIKSVFKRILPLSVVVIIIGGVHRKIVFKDEFELWRVFFSYFVEHFLK